MDHGLERPRFPGVYQINGSVPAVAQVEACQIRFPSAKPTVDEFIRSIESQTPLRHFFAGCGNAGASILFGRNWSMGLHLRVPE